MRERLGATAKTLHIVEVQTSRREQVGPVVVLFLEHPPHEREAVRVHAGRREADHDVAGLNARTIDQLRALDDTDARRRKVELFVAVHVGHLGRLAADERDVRFAADLGGALDQLGDLLEVETRRGHVVEQEQRPRARRDHVVDAVRGHVRAAVAERAARPGDDRLRSDRVHRGRKEAPLVERVEPGEGPEPCRAGRLDRLAQPFDHPLGRGERNARVRICLATHRRESMTRPGYPKSSRGVATNPFSRGRV